MKIRILNRLFLQDIPRGLADELKSRLSFRNPAWLEAKKMGRWTGNLDEYLQCFEVSENGLTLPRGFCRQLITLCRARGIQYQIVDNRRTLPEADFHFTGELRDFQKEAVSQILKRDFGTLSSPTGSGKTVMALAVVAERQQPALIVVHTKELLNQWIARIGAFLALPVSEIGIIGDGKKIVGDKIMVALVQSLYKCASDIAPYIGHLIIDECHRAPSRTFSEAVQAFDSKFMLGLSATPYRRDGLDRLIYRALGDVVHEVDSASLVKNGDILQADVVLRQTEFSTRLNASEEYSKVLSELTQDSSRNHLIARDVATESRNGSGVCLVLSDRKSHCDALRAILSQDFNTHSELLTGDLPKNQRESSIDRLNRGRVKVLVATGQLIGEGFDCRNLTTLFLATPIRFDGRVLQYLGRVLRPAPGKIKAKVYDYVDSNVGVLKASGRARQTVYEHAQLERGAQ